MTTVLGFNLKTLFIAIEGLDGSGGTTQSRLLTRWLEENGHQVLLTKEPTAEPIGRLISKILGDPHSPIQDQVLPYLFVADRKDHISRIIQPKLKDGTFVITDRYYHSSLAYQAQAIGFNEVATLNAEFPSPDCTFFLYLDPEASFERVQLRGLPTERFETLDRLRAIAEAYKTALDYCRNERKEKIIQIDAARSIEEIHEEIVQHLQKFLN